MVDVLFICNAGSSSIKFALFEAMPALKRLCHGEVEDVIGKPLLKVQDAEEKEVFNKKGIVPGHHNALCAIQAWIKTHDGDMRITATGHRVVHGGKEFSAPVRVTDAVMTKLEALVPLAPLHQPCNLEGIKALRKLHWDIPHIACFDTAFHHAQPKLAELFALPRNYYDEGVVRYGFHGLSYEYIAGVLPEYAGAMADGRVIVAHLGNGASMCAMKKRRSVATTMGFTALDGLMMGTRCGTLDPGVVLYLMEEKGMSVKDVTNLLYKESGLKGVSGVTHDMQTLLESEMPHAKEAIELFCYQAARQLAGLIPALGGLDVLVFTAGIGEHTAAIRKGICDYLGWLGLEIDEKANSKNAPAIHADKSCIEVLVIATDEERMMAQHVLNGR